jgi:hypothetical protein
MQFMDLIIHYHFMQILNIERKHCTKHFSKNTLISTIYLLHKQKLNPNKYSEHDLIMGNFVQATAHDVDMYAKFGDFTI